MKIGFAGLGNMGSRLASCLVGVGDLTVYDVHEPSREAFRGRARVAGSVAETGAGADVVGLCVRTGEQVRECADAVLPVMREGGMLMIHSTVSPDLVLAVARDWPAAGFQKTPDPAGRSQANVLYVHQRTVSPVKRTRYAARTVRPGLRYAGNTRAVPANIHLVKRLR